MVVLQPEKIEHQVSGTYLETIWPTSIPSRYKAGAKSIMVSSGEINGTPVHASKRMITDILKNRIGFEGVGYRLERHYLLTHTSQSGRNK
jgi:beta-glucosidase